MKVDVINQTIRAMCTEVAARDRATPDWRSLKEQDLLYEASVCIIGSQMAFELALATADRLHAWSLIGAEHCTNDVAYRREIVAALSEPVALEDEGRPVRWVRPRFKNRIAALLTSTVVEIYGKARSLHGLLAVAPNAKTARQELTQVVWGFGPKQASLFLRRVGYCADLAVLDVHVLDYLRLARGLTIAPARLGHLSSYEEVEEKFQEVAAGFGHTVGCVDLATWLTMRVAKRASYL